MQTHVRCCGRALVALQARFSFALAYLREAEVVVHSAAPCGTLPRSPRVRIE
jgi:hypothetical protein